MVKKCKCGSEKFHTIKKGLQVGLYCSTCGLWQKWLNKNERNLISDGTFKIPDKNRIGNVYHRSIIEKTLSYHFTPRMTEIIIETMDRFNKEKMDKIFNDEEKHRDGL